MLYTHNHILVLVIMENCFLSEMSTVSFPLWLPVTSFYFVTHPLLLPYLHSSTPLKLPVIWSCYVSSHFGLCFLPSSLDLMTFMSMPPCSHGFQPHFRQTLNPQSLQVFTFFFSYSQSFFGPTTKIQNIFLENNHQIVCISPNIQSCSHEFLPPLGLTHDMSLVIPLSFTRHPFPAYILLYKVLPGIHSFLRRWVCLLHGHIREHTGL